MLMGRQTLDSHLLPLEKDTAATSEGFEDSDKERVLFGIHMRLAW